MHLGNDSKIGRAAAQVVKYAHIQLLLAYEQL